MIIRDNKNIPQEVENFLLKYEEGLKLDIELDEGIELIEITNTDIFEGILIYWEDDQSILQVVMWNSWYNDPPEIFNLIRKDIRGNKLMPKKDNWNIKEVI